MLLTIGGRLAKVESIREPTTISTYTMLAGQARREQCVCTTSYHLSFSPSTVAQWLWPSPSVYVLLFKSLSSASPSSPTLPHVSPLLFAPIFFAPRHFFSYSRDNAKSCRMNASSLFDGAPSFCSRKFSAVTPFSSPVSARWPTQFGKQMLSM